MMPVLTSETPHTQWRGDGRTMVVTFDFGFRDRAGIWHWSFRGDIIDGASIPKYGWSIVGSPYVGNHRVPAAIHDSDYVYRRNSRKVCDRGFLDSLKFCGASWEKRHFFYRMVRDFGAKPYNSNHHDDFAIDELPKEIMNVPQGSLVPPMWHHEWKRAIKEWVIAEV